MFIVLSIVPPLLLLSLMVSLYFLSFSLRLSFVTVDCGRFYTRFVDTFAIKSSALKKTIFINDRGDLSLNGALFTVFPKRGPHYISSVRVAFLSPNNAWLFPQKRETERVREGKREKETERKKKEFRFHRQENSVLYFPAKYWSLFSFPCTHKGIITYCQLWGKPQSSTVAQQIGCVARWLHWL